MCFEANCKAENDTLPLMVLAISESVLSWETYINSMTMARAGPGHYNPAVHAAVAQVTVITNCCIYAASI